MEPHEHPDVEKNTANSSPKDNTEVAFDDSPTEEPKGNSNEGGKETETDRTAFSLSNSRQSRKLTLLDSANTKDKNDPKQNEDNVGFGYSDRLKRDYSDPARDAMNFFGGPNPYSLDPISRNEIRCQETYQDPSVLQSAANFFLGTVTAIVNTVSSLTGQTTLLRAGLQAAATGGDMLEIAMSATPVGIAIDLTIGVGLTTRGIYDQHQNDLERANADRVRCERDFLKDFRK